MLSAHREWKTKMELGKRTCQMVCAMGDLRTLCVDWNSKWMMKWKRQAATVGNSDAWCLMHDAYERSELNVHIINYIHTLLAEVNAFLSLLNSYNTVRCGMTTVDRLIVCHDGAKPTQKSL